MINFSRGGPVIQPLGCDGDPRAADPRRAPIRGPGQTATTTRERPPPEPPSRGKPPPGRWSTAGEGGGSGPPPPPPQCRPPRGPGAPPPPEQGPAGPFPPPSAFPGRGSGGKRRRRRPRRGQKKLLALFIPGGEKASCRVSRILGGGEREIVITDWRKKNFLNVTLFFLEKLGFVV